MKAPGGGLLLGVFVMDEETRQKWLQVGLIEDPYKHYGYIPDALLFDLAHVEYDPDDPRIQRMLSGNVSKKPMELTPRMIECAQHLATCCSSNQETADHLGISVDTVRCLLVKAYVISNTRSITHLVTYCFREGLIDLDTRIRVRGDL